jgi:hypothetical protein
MALKPRAGHQPDAIVLTIYLARRPYPKEGHCTKVLLSGTFS